jgi:hypothetical protein
MGQTRNGRDDASRISTVHRWQASGLSGRESARLERKATQALQATGEGNSFHNDDNTELAIMIDCDREEERKHGESLFQVADRLCKNTR